MSAKTWRIFAPYDAITMDWKAKGLFKRMQHCPTLLDQQCWTIVGQRVQTDATISQQLLAVQLVQNSVRK